MGLRLSKMMDYDESPFILIINMLEAIVRT